MTSAAEKNAPSAMWIGRIAAEIEVVHRADHAAERIEDDVEIHHARRRFLRNHAEQHEDIGDHDGGEELEKILHPEVHDPEAPEVHDGEIRLRVAEQPNRIEERNRKCAVEKERRQVARALRFQLTPKPAAQDDDP